MNITLLPSAKVPLIYPDTNGMTTEWYRFFWNIYGFTGTGVVPVNKGGTGLDTIGDHQLIIGNANNVFEPTTLVGSGITITYGTGTVTLAIGNSGVTPGTYGSASKVGQFTVDVHGTLVFAQDVNIAIDASQIISGTINTARISGSYTGITGVGTLTVGTWNATTIGTGYGGTGLTSFTSGGALYATSTSVLTSGTLPVTAGGTGQTSFTNGQLLIGNTTGNTLAKATLTAGTGISISNGAGAITITNTAPSSGGTVTSVGLSLPAEFTVTNSPVTSSGTLTATWASETAKYFFAAPNATAGTPSFRAIVASDIPSLSGTYIPYTGASNAIDLNAETVTNIAHLGIGTTTVPTILLRAFGDNGTESRIAMRGYSSNANGSAIRVTKFRGTYSSPQVPQSGDSLGRFEFAGYCTTSANGQVGVSLEGITTEMWGATALGSKLQFKVTPNTTTTPVLALTIDQDKSATFASSVTATSFSGSGSGLTSIPNSALTNSTISGVALGGNLFNLTAGTGVSFSAGTTYNGSTAITITATGSGGTVTSVTGTAPVVSSGGTTPAISMAAATTSVNGYLTSTDWNTFNGKQPAGSYLTAVSVVSANGFAGTSSGGTTPALTLSTSITGILKGNGTAISAATSGTDYAPATSGSSILYGNGAGGFSNVTIGTGVSFAGGTLSATGSGGTVTSVAALTLGTTGTDLSSTVANGTTTPVITLQVPTASATNRGALSAADWTTFNGKAPAVTYTTNYIPYGQGTTTLNQSSNLQFTATGLGLFATAPRQQLTVGSYLDIYSGAANSPTNSSIRASSAGHTIVNATGGGIIYLNLDAGSGGVSFANGAGGVVGSVNSTGLATMASFVPSGSTVPTNGMYLPAANTLGLATNTGEKVRIFSSGGVSIGNTTDAGAGNLYVNTSLGVGAVPVSAITAQASLPFATIAGTGSGAFGINLLAGTAAVGTNTVVFSYNSATGENKIGGLQSYVFPTFYAGGSEKMRISTAGGVSIGNTTDAGANNLSVTGTGKFGTTVGVGAATPSASGSGITFPATQSASSDANTLDDYEEGAWTPTGNGISFAAGTAGKYTKIGNLVTLTFTVVFPTTIDTNNAYVTAMPFLIGGNSAAALANYTSGINLLGTAGNSYMLFLNPTGTAFITNAGLSTQTIVGSFSYQI